MILELVLLFILIVFSLMDFKFRAIPSIFLTGMLFIILVLKPENLINGIALSLLGLILYELDLKYGLADIKVMAMIGLMIPTLQGLANFCLIFAVFQIIYVSVTRFLIKTKEIPFIPLLTIIYSIIIFGGFI